MASADDVVSQLQSIARQLGNWVTAFNGRVTLGTMTLSAATTTVVTQPAVKSNSFIALTPTNGTAALTQRSGGLFVSAYSAGVSFSVSTQNGSAIGTETLSYIVWNPS